jgi:general secretion pathway protein G
MACRTGNGEHVGGRTVRGGFTLIELIVVMSIIATLLTIAVPRYFKSLERSKEVVLRQDLAVLRDAIDKFNADLGHKPETLANLVDHRYIRSLPVDPFTKTPDAWIATLSDDEDDPGIVDVHSGAQGAALDGTPFLAW